MKLNINFSLIKKENTGLKHFNDHKAFIQYSNDNTGKERKILIAFDDLIADMIK